MIRNAIAPEARHAGATSRRGALGILGAAVITRSLAAPAYAGKGGKKAKKRCRKQPAQCAAAVEAHCAQSNDLAICEQVYLTCCARFTGCQVQEGIFCILTAD